MGQNLWESINWAKTYKRVSLGLSPNQNRSATTMGRSVNSGPAQITQLIINTHLIPQHTSLMALDQFHFFIFFHNFVVVKGWEDLGSFLEF
jgi:hypothetical protein